VPAVGSLDSNGIRLPFDIVVEFPIVGLRSVKAEVVTTSISLTSGVSGEPPIALGSQTSLKWYLNASATQVVFRMSQRFSQGIVLDANELQAVQVHVDAMNKIVRDTARVHRVPVVPINKLLEDLKRRGRTIGGRRIQIPFSDRQEQNFFSLDGIHPSSVGYTVIADQWIKIVNDRIQSRPRRGFGGYMQPLPAINASETQPVDP
jgi:hypothetical protein